MPLFLIIGVTIIVLVSFAVYKARKGSESGSIKIIDVVVFALSLIALVISTIHFRSSVLLTSEYNIPVSQIYGYEMGGIVAILKLAVLFVLSLILGLRLIKRPL